MNVQPDGMSATGESWRCLSHPRAHRPTNAKSGYGTFEVGANYIAARLRMTYEVVSSVWGIASTGTVRASSLLEAVRKASEELSGRSYAGYIISVRQGDSRAAKGGW
jgi:hypothetical protein